MRKKIIALFILLCISLTAVACDKTQNTPVTVTFVTGCETVIEPIVLDGTEKFMPDDPIRAGYEFGGWYYDQSFFVPFKTSDAITGDLTLYAKWIKKTSDEDREPPKTEDTVGIVYTFADDFYIVQGYTGTAESIVVPARYNGYPVMKIGKNAFSKTNLKRISFGRNIVSVEEYAFRGAALLEYIEVDDGNAYYCDKEGALYNKEGTALVCVPQKKAADGFSLAGVTNIYPYAFDGCAFKVILPDDYSVVESFAFAGFAGSVNLGAMVTEIRKDAFNGARCSVSFGEGNSMTSLRNGAFAGFCGEKLVLPGTLSLIDSHAFSGCSAIVDMSKTALTSLGENAFSGYVGKALTIPATVSSIGKYAFYGATTEIRFESGSLYTEIGESAFYGFGGAGDGKYLGTVYFPSSVNKIGEYAFYGSYSNVYFALSEEEIYTDENAFVQFKGKCVFNKNS